MAEALQIHFNERQIAEVKNMLAAIPRGFQKAATRAINKTAVTIRQTILNVLKGEMPLKVSDMRKGMPLRKASYNRLMATITVSGKTIPLIKFKARDTRIGKGGKLRKTSKGGWRKGAGQGVTFRISGKEERLSHAFIATMKSGHTGVFERMKDRGRFPIKEKFGPSMAGLYKKHDVKVRGDASSLLARNLNQQIDVLLQQSMKKAA